MKPCVLFALACLAAGYSVEDSEADHRAHAIALDESGDAAGALDSFRAAAKFAPDDARNWFNLGTALLEARDRSGASASGKYNEEALHCYRTAVQLDPANADAAAALSEMQALGGGGGDGDGDGPRMHCDTTKGPLVVQLLPRVSPIGVMRVQELVQDQFFSGVALFRSVPGFLVQFGQTVGESRWNAATIADDTQIAAADMDMDLFPEVPESTPLVTKVRRFCRN